MRLSMFYNLDKKFGRLTWVNWGCFLYVFFKLIFLLNFIFQHWDNWGLSFIIYFKFYSIRLSRSYDLGCGFDKLTQFIFCLSFQFHHSTLSLLEIRFYNLFWFGLYRIIIVSHLGLQTSMLTQINSNWFNMLLFQYLYKKITLNIYFEPNYIFISRLDYFYTLKLTKSHRINLYIIF